MTRTRYYILRFGQAFGIDFKARHSTAAATEVHLLREAEEILGALSWQDLENAEEISMEYWSLRKLTKERDALVSKIEKAQEILASSHDERASHLENVVERTHDLFQKREAIVEKSDRLNAERELILGEARSVKRRHDGCKAKLDVLTEEGSKDEDTFAEARSALVEAKKRFKHLRARRDEITKKIDVLDAEIEANDEKIKERRAEIKGEASGDFGAIGQANKDISQTRAKLGILEQEMNALFSELGKYVANNQDAEEIDAVTRPHRSLISQIGILRTSVKMNRTLSGRF